MSSYLESEKSSVTLTLIPAAIVSSIAGTPSAVPGILMKMLGRSMRRKKSGAAATEAAVSFAIPGGSSNETKPSRWPLLVIDMPDLVGRLAHVRDRELEEGVGGRHAGCLERGDGAVVVRASRRSPSGRSWGST